MKQYLIDCDLPTNLTAEFISLIPKHREQVDGQFATGKITSYTLSQDHSKLWLTCKAVSEAEVMDLLSSFALTRFMRCTVHELMLYEKANENLPQVALN